MIRLGERLGTLGDRTFVGRAAELALFRGALEGRAGAPSVMFVHGPGGIGKSALLHRFATVAAQAARTVVRLDARLVDPTPSGLDDAAAPALSAVRPVLLVDGFECREALEGRLREHLLPRLPEDAVVVVAGRRPPSVQWRADPGWVGVLKVIALRDLSPDDAADLLRRRGVAPDRHAPLLAFAGGHPLALVCLAARSAEPAGTGVPGADGDVVRGPGDDVVGTLLAQLLGELPSPAHRHALEVSALALTTNEELLRDVLPGQAAELFDWLRRQPFVEPGEHGLRPHAVVREALEADLRWRDPEGYAIMRDRIRRHLAELADGQTGAQAVQTQAALAYLLRHRTALSRYLTWAGPGETYGDAFRESDRAELVRMARQTEGDESAALVGFWLDRQPRAFTVYRRSRTSAPVAFLAWLRLREPVPDEVAADPVVAAAWAQAAAHGPLRDHEHLGVARFLVDPAAYQRPSGMTDGMLFRISAEYRRARGLAWSFVALADPDYWAPLADYLGTVRVPGRVVVGDRAFALFGHDWRAQPFDAWVESLGRQGRASARADARGPFVVLGREQFDRAVRDALRVLRRRDGLSASPLLRTRLVAGGGGEPVETLREALADAVAALDDARLHRAVHLAYLDDDVTDVTQERAAERLGVSLSSYKRHLARGTELVCERLWRRELHGHQTSQDERTRDGERRAAALLPGVPLPPTWRHVTLEPAVGD